MAIHAVDLACFSVEREKVHLRIGRIEKPIHRVDKSFRKMHYKHYFVTFLKITGIKRNISSRNAFLNVVNLTFSVSWCWLVLFYVT